MTDMSSLSEYAFETLRVTSPREYVYNVELNRPKKLNAMNRVFWKEFLECFNKIAQDQDCRVVVLSAAGRIFTAGLDLSDGGSLLEAISPDVGRKAFIIGHHLHDIQKSFNAIEKCPKPVIVAVHNACVGGGIDLMTACDIRYCSNDAWFSIKEVDIGVTADVGTLQRLPKVVGNESLVRELAFTARKMFAEEAKQMGLVSRIFPDKESMIAGAIEVAEQIASKSPIAVQGTKVNLVYTRDHSVPDSLNYVATWNQSMLQSEDVVTAVLANMQKEKATFSKL